MVGEINLQNLLASMQPYVTDTEYVFISGVADSARSSGILPLMTFREKEGATWIVTQEEARQLGYVGSFHSRMITLTVHSALEAVGFLAVITSALASAGISVNAVSAFYHDHLFVPSCKIDEALKILTALAVNTSNSNGCHADSRTPDVMSD